MTTQKTDQTRRELSVEELQISRKPFVEPEMSGPVDVLEATAFFQTFVGPADPGTGFD